jgi:predicted RNase H-like HicB family nuclease
VPRQIHLGGIPGAYSQGRSRQEARENVIDALHGILELRFHEHALSEPASDLAFHGLESRLPW